MRYNRSKDCFECKHCGKPVTRDLWDVGLCEECLWPCFNKSKRAHFRKEREQAMRNVVADLKHARAQAEERLKIAGLKLEIKERRLEWEENPLKPLSDFIQRELLNKRQSEAMKRKHAEDKRERWLHALPTRVTPLFPRLRGKQRGERQNYPPFVLTQTGVIMAWLEQRIETLVDEGFKERAAHEQAEKEAFVGVVDVRFY
jgi:hypothetical protein